MYSFGQRMEVVDEPFYAAFLKSTGLEHPMHLQAMKMQPTDPLEVIKKFPKEPHYLKLMTHHMLPGVPLDWAEGYKHIYLIRHPTRVVSSYLAKREEPELDDIGFHQQALLFERFGGVVINSHDILAKPKRALNRLCDAIGLPFDPTMLSWPQGGHKSDGIWASHWYDSAHRSTGFSGVERPMPKLEHPLINAALPFYEELSANALAI